ncbi:hypothetical protein POCGH01_00226400 [Plasmodium ovale]|nr:hypothetical protein POCGH01_00226400 [Plasmodium ovale]
MREEITSSEGGDCNKYFDDIFDIAKIYKDLNTLCESDNNCNKFYISSQYPNPQILLGLSSCSEIADTKRLSLELALLLISSSTCRYIFRFLTPIGPWFYNQVFKKKLIRNYFNEEDSQEFLEHTSDSLDMNS